MMLIMIIMIIFEDDHILLLLYDLLFNMTCQLCCHFQLWLHNFRFHLLGMGDSDSIVLLSISVEAAEAAAKKNEIQEHNTLNCSLARAIVWGGNCIQTTMGEGAAALQQTQRNYGKK